MITMTPEQALAFRATAAKSADGDMHYDVGYFIVWYSAVELGITGLLATASRAHDLQTFDDLCAGMDCRVKIERLRRILKRRNIPLGPNLDARLRYVDEKARRLRNRIAHAFLARSESGPNRYYASSLGSLPWVQLGQVAPFPSKPPVVITPEELLGWGAWLAAFTGDISAAFNQAVHTGEYEIVNPGTMVPQEGRGTPVPTTPRANDDTQPQTDAE
jgi:hypothetical protein